MSFSLEGEVTGVRECARCPLVGQHLSGYEMEQGALREDLRGDRQVWRRRSCAELLLTMVPHHYLQLSFLNYFHFFSNRYFDVLR